MTRRELHLENVRLAEENRQLRGWLTKVLLGLAQREQLVSWANEEIERRFPERGQP